MAFSSSDGWPWLRASCFIVSGVSWYTSLEIFSFTLSFSCNKHISALVCEVSRLRPSHGCSINVVRS
jgi:hypothetical protein